MQRVWYLRLDSRLCCTYPMFLRSQTSTRRPAVPTISRSPATDSVYTFSGCVKVPALQGVLGSHSLTDMSQLPVTITLTSGQNSTQRMGASCVPTIVSEEEMQSDTSVCTHQPMMIKIHPVLLLFFFYHNPFSRVMSHRPKPRPQSLIDT